MEEEEVKNLKRELELERGIRKELEQAKKLLERECHEREQAVQILRQQVGFTAGGFSAVGFRAYYSK